MTISLESIRNRVGDQWPEICRQLLQNAEMVIRAHLGPKDSLCVTPAQDFLVCFADTQDDQLVFKTNLIRDEIWEQLFSITNDEELSSIDAQSYEISVNLDDIDEESIFSEIDQIVSEVSEKEKEIMERQLEQIYKYDEFYAITLVGASGAPSKIKSLSFEKKIRDRARNFFQSFQQDGEFLLDIQNTMFERLKEKLNFKKAYAKHALLLPLGFALMCNPKTRDGLIELCQGLEKSLGLVLIIEVIDTPDRLKPHSESLKPLPVGRQLQFMELRRPQQADGVALDQLGVAYVSMSYDNIEANQAKGFGDFMKRLKDQGVKLYIKDIPEGKLFEAQRLQGSLLSMRK